MEKSRFTAGELSIIDITAHTAGVAPEDLEVITSIPDISFEEIIDELKTHVPEEVVMGGLEKVVADRTEQPKTLVYRHISRTSFAPLPESTIPEPGIQIVEPDEEADWQERALCAQTDPETFFPEKGGSTKDAKKICAACDVKQDCLMSALDNDERFGIWGGLSERERRRLKKQAV